MKTLYKIFIFAIFLMAAQCRKEPDMPATLTSISYDLVSLSLSYGQIPQEGGTVSPMLAYEYKEIKKWSDGAIEETSHNSDAEVSYKLDNDIFILSPEGKVTAKAGNGLTRSANVTVEIEVSDIVWTTTAKVIQTGSDCIVEYCDLTITEFSYPAVPQEGGSVTPVLTYTYTRKTIWSDGNVDEETLTQGAECIFTTEDDITLTEDGTAGVKANGSVQTKSLTVKVILEVEGLSIEGQATIIQDGSEDRIISSTTVQLPLELEPHTAVYPIDYFYPDWEPEYLRPGNDTRYGRIAVPWTLEKDDNIQTTDGYGREDFSGEQGWEGMKREITYESHSRDGRPELSVHTWMEINDYPPDETDFYVGSREATLYESVSASGVEIKISGGQLATVNEYLSGKKDTVIIAEPVYSTGTTYRLFKDNADRYPNRTFWKETGFREKYQREDVTIDDNPDYRPHSSISNKVWRIRILGPDIYVNILHTLKAKVNGYETVLTIRQNPNFRVGYTKDSNWIEFTEYEPYIYGRQNLPDFEDYPYGSKPKWAVVYRDGVAAGYLGIDGTRGLHPDRNRAVDFRYWLQAKFYEYEYVYLNGTKTHYYNQDAHTSLERYTKITVTAKANVPLENNTVRHFTRLHEIEHRNWASWGWQNAYPQYLRLTPESSMTFKNIPNYNVDVFGICLPVQKDAVSDFDWEITIHTTLLQRTDKNRKIIVPEHIRQQIEAPYNTIIKDKKLTWEEFSDKAQISGMFDDRSMGFIIDKQLAWLGCTDCE